MRIVTAILVNQQNQKYSARLEPNQRIAKVFDTNSDGDEIEVDFELDPVHQFEFGLSMMPTGPVRVGIETSTTTWK